MYLKEAINNYELARVGWLGGLVLLKLKDLKVSVQLGLCVAIAVCRHHTRGSVDMSSMIQHPPPSV